MKINCPNCATGFSVPETALGPRGRKLKCVRCGHLWHQEPITGAGATANPAVANPVLVGPEGGGPNGATTTAPPLDAGEAGTPRPRPGPPRGPLSSHLEAEEPVPDSAEATPPPAPDLALADPQPPARDEDFDPAPDPIADDIPMDSEPDRPRRGPPTEDEGPEPDLDDILARLGEQERERSRLGDGIEPDALADDFDLDDDDREALPGILRTQLKAQRRGLRPPSWASALVVVVVLLAGTAGGFYLGRNALVGMWPAAEKWYAALGIPLSRPGLGLTLEKVVPTHELVEGNKLLVVRGFITNTSDMVRPVPALRLALKDEDKELVQQMVAAPPAETLAPGETTTFRMTVENLLPEAAIIDVGFTDRQPEPVMAPGTPPGLGTPVIPAQAAGDSDSGGDHGGGQGGSAAPSH